MPDLGNIVVDMRPVISKLKLALQDYSDEVQRRALYNALNKACQPLRTVVRRFVTKQTSAPYSRVASHIRSKNASPSRLVYKLLSSDKPMRLSEFKPTPAAGATNVKLTVWGKSRTFHKAFAVRFGDGQQIVKRTGHHSRGKGPLNVKTLYGPIIPKEMLRDGFPSKHEIERAVPDRLLKRLPHELEQAVARAKARSGT